ncbi:MmyB family transcriptional regulator [Streptomyces tsukubensis]|uniref:MmyB family transcriptional regulator n=1 Tax=Streptomyces tsukubensis TaxID=83656 RepID=UPI00117CAD45|nr:helix-turn-helix domain-containing protein [Streptomyces tsukubensis]QFR96066.1 hypothetical protein GBW32_27235 [Streptomyces tsukubensis]
MVMERVLLNWVTGEVFDFADDPSQEKANSVRGSLSVSQELVDGLDIKESLTEFLKRCRSQRRPEEAWRAACEIGLASQLFPEAWEGSHRTKTGASRGLTQEQMAFLLRYSSRQWANFERGEARIPQDLLDKICIVLGMNSQERWLLYRLVLQRDPLPYSMPHEPKDVDPMWETLVRLQPFPCYIADSSWNSLVVNRSYRETFPSTGSSHLGDNIARWVLLEEEAEEYLYDWRDSWAKPLLMQVRSAFHLDPDNQNLRDLVRDCADSSRMRTLWAWQNMHDVVHSDGEVRAIIHPKSGITEVKILAATPFHLHHLGYRFVAIVPTHLAAASDGHLADLFQC